MGPPYLEIAIGFIISSYLFETYLDIRQLAAAKLPTLPKSFEGVVTHEKFLKSRAYRLDIRILDMQYAFIPVGILSSIALNLVSRAHEFQADAFAMKLGYGKAIRAALLKMEVNSLGSMNMDPWFSAYHNTHPTLVERIAALDESDVNKED